MFLYKPNIFRSYNIVSGTTDNNLSFVESNFSEEILKLTKLLQIKPNSIHRLTQVHGNDYLFLEESTNLEQIKQSGDAIITPLKNTLICVKTADCIPLFIFDPIINLIAICHLGRAGLVAGLAQNVLSSLIKKGANANNLLCSIGPSLLAENHIVFKSEADKFPDKYVSFLEEGDFIVDNNELFKKFMLNNPDYNIDNSVSAYVDPTAYLVDILISLGVLIKNIEISGINTFQSAKAHSYRRDYPNHGMMLSYIMLV